MDKSIIHSVFEAVVDRQGEKTAIVCENNSTTYSHLNSYANRIAHLLRSIGCEAETIVNVLAPSSMELVASLLGIFKAGGIYLPVDPDFSRKRLEQIFRTTCNGYIITTQELLATAVKIAESLVAGPCFIVTVTPSSELMLSRLSDGTLTALSLAEAPRWTNNPDITVNGDSSNYIFYTSGSTGEAKAIVGRHVALSHFVHWEIKEFGIGPSFRISQLAQVTFDASLRDIFTALISGGTLHIPSAEVKNSPADLLNWLISSQITMVHCVPSLFRLWIKEMETDSRRGNGFSDLQYILMAGEMIYVKDVLRWRAVAGTNVSLVNLYGPTETTLIKLFHRIGQLSGNQADAVPVGLPISNTVVAIIREGRLCRPGEKGEIYIKTPFMTKGYYNNSRLTEKSFVQNPLQQEAKDIVYKTGDLGRYLFDGTIEVLGRIDNQIKVNGVRVEPGEIEQAILRMDGISGVVVDTHKSEDAVTTLVAYYSGDKKMPEEISAFLFPLLNRQLIPSYFVYVEKFPLNVNGKIDRRALTLPEDMAMGGHAFVPPQGATEIALETIFKEVLGHKKIGRNISFFDIGGHSLRAIQLLSRIHRVFQVKMKVADVFHYKTIEKLAAFIQSCEKVASAEMLVNTGETGDYALSPAQKRLWILAQLENGNAAFNMSGVYNFKGILREDAFHASFQALISRHEVLRTAFRENAAGEARQWIHEPGDFPVCNTRIDLRGNPDQETLVTTLIRDAVATPFDLANGPLLKVQLYRVADDQWIFVYVVHHIICDGWSMNVIIRELLQLYTAFCKGEDPGLPPLKIRYRDYLSWRSAQFIGSAQHKTYWKQQLSGELPVLELPTDRRRPVVKSYAGGVVHRKWGRELVQDLNRQVLQENTTLYTGLLALVYTLLYRYTGQSDIIVGSPFASRDTLELESQVGLYINTLPLRTVFGGGDTFAAILGKAGQTLMGAYEYQAYDLDHITDELQQKRDTSRSSLFDVLVVLQNNENTAYTSGVELDDLVISGYPATGHAAGRFDLSFYFVEVAGEIHVSLEYSSDLFDRETAERIICHLEQLAAAAVLHPALPVQQLDYLGQHEKDMLLHTFNNTDVVLPPGKTMIDFFEAQVQLCPESVALVSGEKMLTYAALNARANQFARYLVSEYGVGPEMLVAVSIGRDEWMVPVVLGIFKTGAAYMPVDPDYPAERVGYMMSASAAVLLVTEDIIHSFVARQHLYNDGNLPIAARPEGLAYVIYTSGSTGTPKGAMIEHTGLLNHLLAMAAELRLDNTSVMAQTAYFTFDISVWQLLNTLLTGGRVVMYSRETVLNPAALAKRIGPDGVTVLQIVPGYLRMMLDVFEEESDIDWSSLQYLSVTGETVSKSLLDRFFRLCPGVKVVNAYGPAEAADDVSLHIMDTLPADSDIPVGKPIQNTRIYVLDAQGMLCPVGIYGEICISGAGVGRGYLNDEVRTQKSFTTDPFRSAARLYKTGDIGRWSADGLLHFAGRRDHQIKLRGHRIELGEIENTLLQYRGIESAVVLVHAETLVAYYIATKLLDFAAIQHFLRNKLPAYMVPARYIGMQEFPLNANGKVDRNKLPCPVIGETDDLFVPPENAVEEQLAAIWEELLGTGKVGRNAHFFEAGGHSLKITRLASHIHKLFNVKPAIGELFNQPVLSAQAEMIVRLQRTAFNHISPAAAQENYVLSSAQRRLWILSQFKEGSLAYHITGTRVLEGVLDTDGLLYAFNAMISRHESLRTSFRENTAGEVRQFIHPAGSVTPLRIEDLRTEKDPEETVRVLMARDALTPFDLASGPLIRASLYHTADSRYILSYTMHHIISDGWSVGIFLKELLQYYNAYVQRIPVPLKDPAIQYKDYAEWQQRQLNAPSIAVHRAYWLSRFSGQVPVLELPADKIRPAVKTYTGRTLERTIGKSAATRFRKLLEAQQCSLFMGLLAVANALLYRYTGQQDIVIGSPVAGREHADLEEQIGFYLNILPLRVRFGSNDSFTGLLDNVRSVTLQAFDHQVFPFEELIAELDVQRDMSRNSLFDVMVVLHNNADQQLKKEKVEGLDISRYTDEKPSSSKFDLSFDFIEIEDVIDVRIEYNDDLFLEETAIQIADHYLRILEMATAEPETPLVKLDFLSAAEKHVLIHQFNGIVSPQPADMTIAGLFGQQVKLHPDAVALVNGDVALTYREVDETACQLANCLRNSCQPSRGDIVGIRTGRHEWAFIAILAVLKTGAAYVPIDPVYPAERINHMIADTNSLMVIDDAFLAAFTADRHQYTRTIDTPAGTADDLVYVMYTSGSTGMPKGVKVTNGNILNTWRGNRIAYGLDNMEVSLLQTASISFDVSMGDLVRAWLCGGKMVLCPEDSKTHPEKIYGLMMQHRINILESTPGVLLPLMEYIEAHNLPVGFLKVLIFGADVLNMDSYRRLYQRYGSTLRLINSYGTTETAIDSTFYEIEGSDGRYKHSVTPIGRPLPNTQVFILNDQLLPQPVGVTGEIYIGGGGVSRGYINRDDLTALKFIPNIFHAGELMYKTGDLGRWLPDGNILFTGRKDGQVKVRGYRIETSEVESVLLQHQDITAAVVTAKEIGASQQELVAYIVDDGLLTPAALRKHIGQFLPSFMVPAYYVSIPELPISVNGKIDKNQLPDPRIYHKATGAAYVPARNEVEEILVRIWQDILGQEQIGIRDDFFDLGGHSLKLMKVASRIYEQFDLRLNVELFFQSPYIEDLARYISAFSTIPSPGADDGQALIF